MKKNNRKNEKPVDYSARYGKDYPILCAIAHKATGGKCCYCLVAKSEEVHHTHYWKSGKAKAGKNHFPVCLTCHKRCHLPENWIKSKKDPVFGPHNTEACKKRLILGFNLLAGKN